MVIMSLGFPAEVDAMEFQNGQGIIGAVMLSARPTAVPDISAELRPAVTARPRHLRPAVRDLRADAGGQAPVGNAFGVRNKKREWTANDQRVLATLGNQGVVAIRNAELYDNNQRSIWELKNLQEALQAATSTLDLNQVLQQVLAGAAKASCGADRLPGPRGLGQARAQRRLWHRLHHRGAAGARAGRRHLPRRDEHRNAGHAGDGARGWEPTAR